MKKLIQFLFSGCWHEWETIDNKLCYNLTTYASGNTNRSEYVVYTLRCKKCGEIKSTHVSYGRD